MSATDASGRNLTIDYMRFVGILSLVLAHSGPPDFIFNLRNFGTPLLVVASAMIFVTLPYHRIFPVWDFIKRRAFKIILPTWIFLTFFFLLVFLISEFRQAPYPYSFKTILGTYSLYQGIGYVWILKVYLFLAIITPLLVFFNKSVGSDRLYFVILMGIYALYEAAYFLLFGLIGEGRIMKFINNTVFVMIPLAVVYAYGFRIEKFSTAAIIKIASAFFMIFLIIALYFYLDGQGFMPTQEFKYPPRLYYLAYALACTNLIFLLAKNMRLPGVFQEVIVWISTHSLWFYLWHILALYIWDEVFKGIEANWLWSLKFLFVLVFAACLTFVQKRIVASLLERASGRCEKWIRIAF